MESLNEFKNNTIWVEGLGEMLKDVKERIDEWLNLNGRYKDKFPAHTTKRKKKLMKWQEVKGYPFLEWKERDDILKFRYGQKPVTPRYLRKEKRWIVYFKAGHGCKEEIFRLYVDEILPHYEVKMKKM